VVDHAVEGSRERILAEAHGLRAEVGLVQALAVEEQDALGRFVEMMNPVHRNQKRLVDHKLRVVRPSESC
jgi:hypothetical protein